MNDKIESLLEQVIEGQKAQTAASLKLAASIQALAESNFELAATVSERLDDPNIEDEEPGCL